MSYTYDVFISYSRRSSSSALVRALQKSLHSFARPLFKLRALRSYRDETNTQATPSLWGAIEQALTDSRKFLLIASSEAAAAPWVLREVDWWLSNRNIDDILIVIAGGKFAIDPSTSLLDSANTDCLPPQLIERFNTSLPFFIDLREVALEPGKFRVNDLSFRDAVQRIASAIHGRPLDEMAGEDVHQQSIRLRIASAAAVIFAALLGASILFGLSTVRSQQEAVRQRDNAILDQAQALAATAANSAKSGDGTRARLFASASLRRQQLALDGRKDAGNTFAVLGNAINPMRTTSRQTASSPASVSIATIAKGFDRGANATSEALAALYQSQKLSYQKLAFRGFPHSNPVLAYDASRERVLSANDDRGLSWIGLPRLKWNKVRDDRGRFPAGLAVNPATGIAAISWDDGAIQLFDPSGSEAPRFLRRQTNRAVALAFDRTGKVMLSGSFDGTVKSWAAERNWTDTTIIDQGRLKGGTIAGLKKIEVAANASVALIVPRGGPCIIVDLRSSTEPRTIATGDGLTIDATISADGRNVAIMKLGGEILVKDTQSGSLVRRLFGIAGGGAVAYSPIENILAVGTNDEIRIYDVADWRERERLGSEFPAMLLFFSSSPQTESRCWRVGRAEISLNFRLFRRGHPRSCPNQRAIP